MNIEKILSLIKSVEPPETVMWSGRCDAEGYPAGYEDGYKEGFADAVAEVYRLIDETENMTYRKLKSYADADEDTRREIEQYISQVDDPQTRQMFTLRFIKGLKYYQVAMELGGGMGADCVKKRIDRYIKKNK